jgi:hypothetical protein
MAAGMLSAQHAFEFFSYLAALSPPFGGFSYS